MGMGTAGAIIQAGGAYKQAQGQRSAMEYQASVAQFNSKIAEGQASDAIRAGQTAEENHDLKTGAIMGAQRAALAANGVDLGSGSANDVLTTTKFMGKRDALQIHDNALMQAWGYRTQAANFTSQAGMLNGMAGDIDPLMSAGTTFLASGAKDVENYDRKAKANGTSDFTTTLKNKWASLWESN